MIVRLSTELDDIYGDLMLLLKDIKLTVGPEGLSSTLRRHKDIQKFVIQFQKDKLKDIENRIADFYN